MEIGDDQIVTVVTSDTEQSPGPRVQQTSLLFIYSNVFQVANCAVL